MPPESTVVSGQAASALKASEATPAESLVGPRLYLPSALYKDAGAARAAWQPATTPKYDTPQVGQSYTGLLGDHFPGKSLVARLNWLHVPLLLGTPVIAAVGCAYWTFDWRTLAFAVFYYFFSGLGITAGACVAAPALRWDVRGE